MSRIFPTRLTTSNASDDSDEGFYKRCGNTNFSAVFVTIYRTKIWKFSLKCSI